MDIKKTMDEALARAEKAIEACTNWRLDQDTPGDAKAYRGSIDGWVFSVIDFDIANQGFPEGSRGYDGAGSKGLMVLHLTRELAEKAVRLAEKAIRRPLDAV